MGTQAGLSIIWIYLSFLGFFFFLCIGSFTDVVHDALNAVCGTQVLPRVDNA